MSDRIFKFGVFEVNERLHELRKHGVEIRIQDQPLQILMLLLHRPGEVVAREEIRARLWPGDTFVDFDSAISSAMRKLREALSDTADNPRFIQTLSRRGYRFIAPIEMPPRTDTQSAVQADRQARRTWLGTPMSKIVAGGLLFVGLIGWRLWSRLESGTTRREPLPLTASSGLEFFPSFSPDGNQIAYEWIELGKTRTAGIYVKTIGSGRPIQVVADIGQEAFPSWSPDGRNIAFIRSNNAGGSIYLVSPSGGPERKVVDGHFVSGLSWSADGRFLATGDRSSPDRLASVHLISTEDGKKRQLIPPPDDRTEEANPVFSPDGQTLVFTRCRERYACGLYVLDLTSDYQPRHAPWRLNNSEGVFNGMSWTPDGKEIVYGFSNGNYYSFRLLRSRVGGGGVPKELSSLGVHQARPAIAPKGDRLAYIQDFSNIDMLQIEPGKPPRSFAPSTRTETYPQYSPDGRRVAFCSDRSGQLQVWTSESDGSNPIQLTNSLGASGTPRWSPDGRFIAFDRYLKVGWQVFVMAADGGQVRQLTMQEGDAVVPSWSRDGQSIYYANNQTGRFEVWKTSVRGGQAIQITRNGGWTAYESLDGRKLYYTKNSDTLENAAGLWEMPAQGGNERLTIDSVCCRAFAVMGDGIYYVPTPTTADRRSAIRFRSVVTAQDREIAPITEALYAGLTVSPDRSKFLVPIYTQLGSNVMVEEGFR